MEVEAGIHHVYARGNDRRAVFLDDADRHLYLARLAAVVERQQWRCLAYCLMGNHVHLLVETAEPNLGSGMHRLQGGYVQRFNKRHGSVGHLFQGRYGAVRVESDAQLWTTAGYIAANPVEAGLCRRPEHWRWSSHAATIGRHAPSWLAVRRLHELFSAGAPDGRRRYAEFVDARVAARR
jgi:REP element-mobilizing transposase RayT